jgi:hypothetical protein
MAIKGTVRITGRSVIRVIGNLKINSAKSKLILEAPVEFYVEGTAQIDGQAIINEGLDPRDFVLYSTGSEVTVNGGSSFYGFIYAPDAEVKINGTSDFFGGAVGRELNISGNSRLHAEVGNGLDEGPNYRFPVLVD